MPFEMLDFAFSLRTQQICSSKVLLIMFLLLMLCWNKKESKYQKCVVQQVIIFALCIYYGISVVVTVMFPFPV